MRYKLWYYTKYKPENGLYELFQALKCKLQYLQSFIEQEIYMEKEETVKNAFVEVAKKYQYLFNMSIDISFNNLVNEVGNKLLQENGYDPEIVSIYNSINNYLRNEITSYVISRFNNDNMAQVLKNIDADNNEQFDKCFLDTMKWKETNNIWISPIEKRLKCFLDNSEE
jgi:hypothetical protein